MPKNDLRHEMKKVVTLRVSGRHLADASDWGAIFTNPKRHSFLHKRSHKDLRNKKLVLHIVSIVTTRKETDVEHQLWKAILILLKQASKRAGRGAGERYGADDIVQVWLSGRSARSACVLGVRSSELAAA